MAHPEFAERMRQACEQAVDILEMHAWNRATRGTERGIWSKDKEGNPVKVEVIHEYSDRLHEVLLRGHRPERYSPKVQAEISGPGGAPFTTSVIGGVIRIGLIGGVRVHTFPVDWISAGLEASGLTPEAPPALS